MLKSNFTVYINLILFGLILSSCRLSTEISLTDEASRSQLKLSIETHKDGTGNTVETVALFTTSDNIKLFAIERDGSNQLTNVPVSWTLNGSVGSLTILEGGKSAEFNPSSPGTGSINISYNNQDLTVTLSISIPPTPTVSNDTYFLDINSATHSASVLNNDSDDSANLPISILAKTDPSNGTVVINGDSLDYTPDPGFYGTDTFTYTAENQKGGQSVGTVTVYVVTPFTWSGNGGDDLWANTSNWCGNANASKTGCAGASSAPGPTDTALFFDACQNCDADITTAVAVDKIEILSSYSGNITQVVGGSQVETITVGTNGFYQAGGAFTGGDASITTSHFDLSGGTFNSTSGILSVSGSLGGSDPASMNLFKMTAGNFNHNNGTVRLRGSKPTCSTKTFVIDVDGSVNLYNAIFDAREVGCGDSIVTVATGDKVVVENDLTHDGGPILGSWDVFGNLNVNAEARGGRGLISLKGTGAQTFTTTGSGRTGYLIIDKASGTVNGATDLYTTGFDLINGSFTAPNLLDITSTLTTSDPASINIFKVDAGTTFTHGGGTVRFKGERATCTMRTFYIDVDSSLNLNNVIFNGQQVGCGPSTVTTASGDKIVVEGDFTQEGGPIYGTWEVLGNFTTGANATGGSGSISLLGSSNQSISSSGTFPTATFTIDSSSTVTLNSAISFNGVGHDLNFLSGNLIMNGFDFTGIDTLYMSGGSVTKTTETISYTSCSGAPCPP